MPIEIKELLIKITVHDDQTGTQTETSPHREREKIVEACVEQVMEILSKKEER